jgi:hypothetical protein
LAASRRMRRLRFHLGLMVRDGAEEAPPHHEELQPETFA